MRDDIDVRVYDNGGETFDRYTVFFDCGDEVSVLGIGDTGNHPAGFCMHVEADEGDHLGAAIEVEAMTEPAQRAVAAELHEISHYFGRMV